MIVDDAPREPSPAPSLADVLDEVRGARREVQDLSNRVDAAHDEQRLLVQNVRRLNDATFPDDRPPMPPYVPLAPPTGTTKPPTAPVVPIVVRADNAEHAIAKLAGDVSTILVMQRAQSRAQGVAEEGAPLARRAFRLLWSREGLKLLAVILAALTSGAAFNAADRAATRPLPTVVGPR